MRFDMKIALCALLAVVGLALSSIEAQSQNASGGPGNRGDSRGPSGSTSLRILLTNDDGVDAAGIKAMKVALEAAGHHVVVGAPAVEQSSSGTRIVTAPFKVEQRSDNTWAIDGSPVDAVNVALQLMGDHTPDLVVSGINQGPNLGPALTSGTVGAAEVAAARRIPAIAVSAGVRPEEATASPVPYPSTVSAYSDAASVVVRMIASLCSPRCDSTMRSGVVINVNYPALPAADIRGLLVVPPAEQPVPRYVQRGADWQVRFEPTSCQNSIATDRAAFYCGHVTVTVLGAIRQLDAPEGRALARRLKGLNLMGTAVRK